MKSPARTPRLRLVTSSLLAALMVSSCVDAPSAPDAVTFAPPFVIAPSLALVGPGGVPAASQAQSDALDHAFDLVDHFRMVVRRLATGDLVVDTIITVTPGQESYDLSVTIDISSAEEQFSIVLTALQGTTELFTSDPVTVTATTATQAASSTPPAPTNVTMQYSGPGVSATSVLISPAALVLGTDGSGSFTAEVQGSEGSVIGNVPLAWTVSAAGVVEVTGGSATATGEGATRVVVATPTGLEASAWAYVVGGELAYAEDGAVKVRGTAGGDATDRSSAGGAGQPAWSPDGSRLFYAAGGRVHLAGGDGLVDGSWPSVSPDGSKLAVDAGGSITFANDDGTHPTVGPSGGTPVWTDGATLLVSGGSVQQVRADGSGRSTLVGGSASLPARGPGGEIAYVADGQLLVAGRSETLLDGATGRPAWSANGMWLVVATSRGLTLAPADGSAPGVPLPGLAAATDPAFKPGRALEARPSVAITGLDPDPPTPGENVSILGTGFDWIIPLNNKVFWPTPDGVVEGEIRSVTETTIEAVMPRSVAEGQIRVETRASTGLLTFDPQFAAIEVIAMTPFQVPVSGIGVVVRDADGAEVLRAQTDDEGRALMAGLTPGTYRVELLAPDGFRIEGEALHSLTLSTETVLVEVEVMPLVKTVTTVPEVLEVEVGSRLEVILVPVDFRGQTMARVSSSRWLGGLPHLAATGEQLQGAIIGAAPGTGPLESVLVVELNGDVFELPVSVTSYVEGTVVQDPDPVTTDSVVDSQPSTVAASTEPSVGTEVKVLQGGVLVSTGIADGTGHYRAGGLFAGTYDVTIDPTTDRTPVPDLQTVVLDGGRPFATADFLMSRAAVDHMALDAGAAQIDALDGTVTVAVTAFDVDANSLGGRRATFVSLDPAVGTVDANGVVTGVTNGVVAIEVTVEGVTATINITVDQKAVVITLLDDKDLTPMPDSFRVVITDTGLMVWEAFDANGYPIKHKVPTFLTSDALVATVDAAGNAVIVGLGRVEMTAEMDGVSDVLILHAFGYAPGDLIISGPSDLAAAAAAQIGAVERDLYVEATFLTDLTGLETLFEVRGNVIIEGNSALTDISALSDLMWVGGYLDVRNNTALLSVEALSSVEFVGDWFRIAANPSLASPTGPFDLRFVGADMYVYDNDAPSFTHLDAFSNLMAVGGQLKIGDMASLTDVDGLSQLEFASDLWLYDNPVLSGNNLFLSLMGVPGAVIIDGGGTSLAFPALGAIGGGLTVGNFVAILTDISLPALACASDVLVSNNTSLQSVDLPALEFIGSGCTVTPPPPPPLAASSIWDDGTRFDLFRVFDRGSDEAERHAADLRATLEAEFTAARNDRIERKAAAAAERVAVRGYGDRIRTLDARIRDLEASPEPELSGPIQERQDPDRTRQARNRQLDVLREGLAELRREQEQARAVIAKLRPHMASFISLGNLRVYGNDVLTTLNVGSLMDVGADVYLSDNPLLTSQTFPLLQIIGEYLNIGSSYFTALDFPVLLEVGDELELYDNHGPINLSAPLLTTIGYGLGVAYNLALGDLVLPSLTSVDWIGVSSNTWNSVFELPVLTNVPGDVDISYNTGLTTIDFASASTLTADCSLTIAANTGLMSINMPGLTSLGTSCTWGGAYIDNNADLELLSLQGLATATDIDLWQNGTAGTPLVVDLTSLATVNGKLRIEGHPSISTLSFPALTTAHDGYDIGRNADLTLLSAPNLRTVGDTDPAVAGAFEVWDNGNTSAPLVMDHTSLEWVEGLFSIGDEEYHNTANVRLETVSFPALTFVGDDFYVSDQTALTSFSAPLLTTIGGWLSLGYDPVLPGFSLPELLDAHGGMDIDSNPVLTSFSFPKLTGTRPMTPPPLMSGPAAVPAASTASSINIRSNPVLTTFDLGAISDVGSIWLWRNLELTNIPAMPRLPADASLTISGHPMLAAVDGLAGVTQLYSLEFKDNTTLADLTGLAGLQALVRLEIWDDGAGGALDMPALQTVWKYFSVSAPRLTSVTLPALTRVWERFTASGTILTSISAPSLTHIGDGNGPQPTIGALALSGNSPLLTSLDLSSLTTVDYAVTIANTGLANLDGLSALTSPVYQVQVYQNAALTSVSGLDGIGDTSASPAVVSSFNIFSNAVLSDCHVKTDLVDVIELKNPGGAFGVAPVISNVPCGQQD